MDTQLKKLDKFAPSRNPYWFDAGTFERTELGGEMTALWAGRKNGRTTVTLGLYRLWVPHSFDDSTAEVEDFITNADTRYGGLWHYRWDGLKFQVEPNAPLSGQPKELVVVSEQLDRILADLPDWFDRRSLWVGPYYKVSA